MAFAGLLCCGPFLTIPAMVVGWMELDAIKKGHAPEAGRWMALAGLWGGLIFTIIHVGGFTLWVLFSMLAASSGSYGY